MSLSEIIDQLPLLSSEERSQVIERAIALDDLSEEEMQLVEERIAAHDCDPETSIPLEKMLSEFREQFGL